MNESNVGKPGIRTMAWVGFAAGVLTVALVVLALL